MKTRLSSAAFTLIELLVVVVIIGLLATLTIGAVDKLQERARVLTCANNLRQLFTASMNYASAKGGRLPLTASEEWLRVETISGETVETAGFDTGWVDWWRSSPYNLRCTYWWNQDNERGVYCVTNGTLWPYLGDAGDEKVYVCPTMSRLARKQFKGDPNEKYIVARSYGMNASLGYAAYNRGGQSRTMLFAEQGFMLKPNYQYAFQNAGSNWQDPAFPQTPADGTYYRRTYRNNDGCIDWRGYEQWSRDGGTDTTYEHIGEYHDGRGNAVFLDGHVERIHYNGTRYICNGNWENRSYFRDGDWHRESTLPDDAP
jgi:prepilin-type N-terminal cleavage/methylation domain-containing protein/prepilin-type processing-associated H-X9-DG protein